MTIISIDQEFSKKLRIRYIRKPNFDKKGVIVAIIDENYIEIGFSLCHKIDKWDFIKGAYIRNFGLSIAINRSKKWFYKDKFSIFESSKKEVCKNFVIIPKTISENLYLFICKLKEKYPCKVFPVWATKFLEAER